LVATKDEVCVMAIVDNFVNKRNKEAKIIVNENEKNWRLDNWIFNSGRNIS